MIKFTYKGVKYDGLIIFPYDANSNDNELFFREYSGIVAKGLLDQEKWIPPIKQDNLNKLIPNNDGTSKAKIPTLDGIETLLFLYSPVDYLSKKRVCELNKKAQDMFKEEGNYYLKEPGILENLLYRVENSISFGVNRMPTLIYKAAEIWYTIARYQAFSNGNKRTALLATVDFLQNSFLKIDISPEKQMENELYGISLRIANGQYDKQNVIEFIKANAVVNFKMIDYVVKNSNIFKK